MPRSPGPGPCVHCLVHVEERTWDHLFPVSWYPDSTPDNLERWKFPACRRCNAEYGELERDLLQRAGLCLDPARVQASGIPERALRAIRPEDAKDERDRRAREAQRQAFLGKMFIPNHEQMQAVIPGFGPHPEAELPLALPISAEALDRLVEKIARGLTYRRGERLIGPEYEIDIFVDPAQGAVFEPLLDRFGRREERGPGITVMYAVPHSDQTASVFSLLLWGTLRLWGTVRPRNSEE